VGSEAILYSLTPHQMKSAGTVGITVTFTRTKIIYTSTDVWYSLPLRTSLRSAAFSTISTNDTPTADSQLGYTIIPLSMRLYTTYNYAERKSATILYSPHGMDCAATLRTFLYHPIPLDIEVDPFSVHLLYLSQAVIDWRNVFQDITNELAHHVSPLSSFLPFFNVNIYVRAGEGNYGCDTVVWPQDNSPVTQSCHRRGKDGERDTDHRRYSIWSTTCT
jgi:hypothetical protein